MKLPGRRWAKSHHGFHVNYQSLSHIQLQPPFCVTKQLHTQYLLACDRDKITIKYYVTKKEKKTSFLFGITMKILDKRKQPK